VRRFSIAPGLFATLAALFSFSTADAAVFTVNDTADAVDVNPGDGICATAAGTCSLRAAVMEASALAGASTVVVGPGHFLLTLGSLEAGPATLSSLLVISGAGDSETLIDGGGVDAVLVTARPLEISGVTVTNGQAGIVSANNFIAISVSNSTVAGNAGVGIGIPEGGQLTLTDSTVRNNGLGMSGGECNLIISRSTISGNGGGIQLFIPGIVAISDSTISDNKSPNGAGGISLTSEAGGPSLAAAASLALGFISITNTTLSGNYGIRGGGIAYLGYGDRDFPAGVIGNSTITNNHASFGGGIAIENSDFFCGVGPRISNSIVAGNAATVQGPDCLTAGSRICPGGGQLPSDGYNLIGDMTSCSFIATTADQVGTGVSPIDPHLGPLADNGGPTMTHALLPFLSPAIDAGSPEGPGSSESACQPTDQRGVTRPQDGDLDGVAVCDVGAFELVPLTGVAIEVNPLVPKDVIVLKSPLPVAVTVLGSNAVDVTKIDVSTLQFGPAAATPVFTDAVRVDGQVDLLALFEAPQTGLAVGDRQACLKGALGGQPFRACDDVVVVRGCGLGLELAPILPALLWLRGRRRRGSGKPI
jgi:CSLREA domain-containing protein